MKYMKFVLQPRLSQNFNRLLRGLLLGLAGTLPLTPQAAPGDQAFMAAYDAYRAGNPMRLARSAAGLDSHVLRPYLDYWRLMLQLDESAPEEVGAYFTQYPGSYTADR